jgi:melibiose permease
MDIPYWSMLPSLSKTKEERDQMSVIPRIFASCAWLIIGTFGLAMVSKLGNGDQTKGFEYFAIGISIIFVLASIITVVNVKDSSSEMVFNDKKEEKTSFKKAFKVIKENDQLMVFIGVVLAYNLVAQLSGGMSIYYFKYVVGNENMYPVFMAFASLAEIGGLMVFPMISKKMSKKAVFRLACYLPAAGLVMLLLSGIFVPGNVVLIALSGIIIKLGSGFTLGATTVMLADVIDYGEVRFGSRNESIIASFQTLLVKTASAISGWLIGVGLTIVGYIPNVVQTPGTVFGMRILMIAVPSLITILGFVIYTKGYKLHGEYQEKIMKELNKNRLNKEIIA